MPPEPIRLAFVGSGNWARKYHFPALDYLRKQQTGYDVQLRGLYSLDPAVAQTVASQYAFDRVYASLDELCQDEAVDAIAVAVTPSALRGVLEKVVQPGLPIFSEKPPGISYTEAKELSQIVTLPNVVAFNRRFIPLNNRFKQIVDEMDSIYFVEGHFFRHNRLDETFVIETGIHWINYLEYLFGPIRTVHPQRFPHPQNDTWVRVAQITFAGGLQGGIKFFPCTGSQGERLEVHSSDRTAYLDGPLWQDPGRIVIEENENQTILRTCIPGNEGGVEVVERGITGEYEEFFRAVSTGQPTRSNFQNAANSMRVAEAIELGVDLTPGMSSDEENQTHET